MSSTTNLLIHLRAMPLLCLGLCLLFATGCGDKDEPESEDRDHADTLVADPELPFATDKPFTADGVKLRWASWSTFDQDKSVDVTETVEQQIRANGRVIWSNELYNSVAGDPSPKKWKVLYMLFDTPTRPVKVCLSKESTLWLSVPPEAIVPYASNKLWTQDEIGRATEMFDPEGYEGTGVVWARWGNDGANNGWVDAAEAAAEHLDTTGAVQNKPKDFGVENKSPAKSKTLRMLVSVDGIPFAMHFKYASYIRTDLTTEQLYMPTPTLSLSHVGARTDQ